MQSVLQRCLVYLHLYSILKSDREITLETMVISMASWFIKQTSTNGLIFLTCPHIKIYNILKKFFFLVKGNAWLVCITIICPCVVVFRRFVEFFGILGSPNPKKWHSFGFVGIFEYIILPMLIIFFGMCPNSYGWMPSL